ncbi:FAD-dependent monooxygenase [Nocardia sp. NPDC052566]|uniref:FAD-dependent monooxygenase n=1 Tax=Nocardia sp. NPDC052566 TaxID=3364330 RepID=UPI0037C672A5
MAESTAHTDVLIVGAGPSGLVLASILAAHGVDFRIVDRKPGPIRQSRAAIVHVRTLELLDLLGLADEAIAQGRKITRMEICQSGRKAASFPLAGRGLAARTPFPFALALEQDHTEALLLRGLAGYGRTVEWNTDMVSMTHTPSGAQVTLGGAGGAHTVSARWVVGADGAHSAVRAALGLEFTGSTYQQTGLLADVDLDLAPESPLADGTIRLNLTRGGSVGMLRLSDGRYRLFGAVPPELAPTDHRTYATHEAYSQVSVPDIQAWFTDYFGVDARVEDAEWTALFRMHSRIAAHFRVGDVFLIGDAAHIHSPAGGQGMNLGIGDAVNLGWKLALTAHGLARPALLESYHTERAPIARKILRGADRGFVFETMRHPLADWIRAHLTPALRLIDHVSPLRAAVFGLFSQTWINYRDSPAVAGTARSGLRPGDRVPDRTGGLGHQLLVFDDRDALARRADIDALLARYAVLIPVRTVPAPERARYGVRRSQLLLIRPDGHCGYLGAADDLDGLDAYLDRFYTPCRSADRG